MQDDGHGGPRRTGSGAAAGRPGATRRRVLAAAGAALTVGLAGCWGAEPEEPEDHGGYEHLRRRTVHVDGSVDLSVPDDVPTAGAREDADLLVLPGDTDVGVDRAVEWLADDRVVALLGEDAEATWLAWEDGDAYRDAFGGEGAADAEPDPDLLVAAAVGDRVTTYRYTWGNEPDDHDVLGKLDGALADLEDRTPRS